MLKRNIEYYVTSSGEKPFIKWLEKLDKKTRIIVITYIDRLADGGTTKNLKPLKDGVYEIKIFYGPGLRVYFAEDGEKIILLLIGGDKKSQNSDIKKAKEYWRDYAQKK